jgi:thioredoxin-dependent peroxiredoxin
MTTVTFKGNPMPVEGQLPKVGTKAPAFSLVTAGLEDVSLSAYAGKKKILTINPSYDTGVCAKAAATFNQRAAALKDTVVLMISADLPFAQKRFCSAEGLETVISLSMMRDKNFGRDYGVLIGAGPLAGVTARAVVVLDQNDSVVYTQLVGEITDEPDYDAALAAAK